MVRDFHFLYDIGVHMSIVYRINSPFTSLAFWEDTTLFPPIEQRPVLFDQRCVAGTDRFSDVEIVALTGVHQCVYSIQEYIYTVY